MNIEAEIRLISVGSNLVSLPADLVGLLYSTSINVQEIVVQISGNFGSVYVGWSGMTSENRGLRPSVDMDSALAKCFNIKDHSIVSLDVKFNPPLVQKLFLEPLTFADWELVEVHAQELEDTLLNQTRAIQAGQTLVVYPSSTTTALLKVVNMEPENNEGYARIAPNCEVSIAPKVRSTGPTRRSIASVRRVSDSVPSIVLKNLCMPHKLVSFEHSYDAQYAVFVSSEDHEKLASPDFVELSLIEPQKIGKAENDKKKDKRKKKSLVAVVRKCSAPKGYIGFSPLVALTLGVPNINGNFVIVRSASHPLQKKPSVLVVRPYTADSAAKRANILLPVKEFLSKSGYFAGNSISNGADLPVIPQVLPFGGCIEFKRADGWILVESIDEFRIDIGNFVLRKKSELDRIVANEIENLGISLLDSNEPIGYEKLKSEVFETLKKDVNGIFISGASGSGKTRLLKSVLQASFSESTAKLVYIDCEDHLNETGNVEVLKKSFGKVFSSLAFYQNVILVLENIHLICPQETEQIDSSSINSSSFSQLLLMWMKPFLSTKYSVKLVLTAASKDAVNKQLLSNPMVINQYFKLSPPDKAQRSTILEHYFLEKHLKLQDSKGVQLNELLSETEGYLASDLKLFVDRIHQECLLDGSYEKVESTHLHKALSGFTPSGLRGITLQNSKVRWDEIGGLKEAKDILLETLEWPIKYAPIFAKSSLRLRSGILLYGYPGCGKTLLASAVAAQCGLNFITVKGPEILNKYIGASEQSVRDLFERAQAAKPCILFFDEFDSIAPKRGHDSTGVTDRVVNQMLTQMDGAEGLEGVYVLAATSRPDLIDSALLRPGRLDKSVLCDIPDLESREDIIMTVTKKMKMTKSVDLGEVVRSTNGFSGADLQALCYNAYLNAVHRRLAQQKPKESKKNEHELFQVASKGIVNLSIAEKKKLYKQLDSLADSEEEEAPEESINAEIQMEDFEKALQETNASISTQERNRLGAIYKEFIVDRDGNMPDGSASNKIGGRTSLM